MVQIGTMKIASKALVGACLLAAALCFVSADAARAGPTELIGSSLRGLKVSALNTSYMLLRILKRVQSSQLSNPGIQSQAAGLVG